MNINYMVNEKNITKYKLSLATNIPYSTISDICNGKTTLENCNAKTVYELAKFFNVTMEDLLYKNNDIRYDFEAFKSNIRHNLKELGFKQFIISTLKSDDITKYMTKKWYPEALYLLAMLDYVSRINKIPLCTKYDSYRHAKLDKIIYPASVISQAQIMKNNSLYEKYKAEAIPEFLQFNIVENEVFDIA